MCLIFIFKPEQKLEHGGHWVETTSVRWFEFCFDLIGIFKKFLANFIHEILLNKSIHNNVIETRNHDEHKLVFYEKNISYCPTNLSNNQKLL